MGQLKLLGEELNREPSIPDHYIEGEPFAYVDGYKIGFKEGTEWKNEQYKDLIHLMRQLLSAYDIRYPHAKQLLVGYTNEQAFDKLNKMLELLQD